MRSGRRGVHRGPPGLRRRPGRGRLPGTGRRGGSSSDGLEPRQWSSQPLSLSLRPLSALSLPVSPSVFLSLSSLSARILAELGGPPTMARHREPDDEGGLPMSRRPLASGATPDRRRRAEQDPASAYAAEGARAARQGQTKGPGVRPASNGSRPPRHWLGIVATEQGGASPRSEAIPGINYPETDSQRDPGRHGPRRAHPPWKPVAGQGRRSATNTLSPPHG